MYQDKEDALVAVDQFDSLGIEQSQCIHQVFETEAGRSPQAVALTCNGESLTYRALNARSNQLAHRLAEIGVGHGTVVGIGLNRSIEVIVAYLAVLKLGAAYLPLDPEYPPERLKIMIEVAGATFTLTRTDLARHLIDLPQTLLYIDTELTTVAGYPATPVPSACRADDLAYIAFTSGSTGLPKAVAAPHRAVVRLVRNVHYVELDPDTTGLQVSQLTFDAATIEIWGTLLNGGRLVIYPDRIVDITHLCELVVGAAVNFMWLTTGLFQAFDEHDILHLTGVRQLIFGGEAASLSHVRRAIELLPQCRLLNAYGPTENTTFSTCFDVRNLLPNATSVPIGRPITNRDAIYVLDSKLKPCPSGDSGELYVAGDGLAWGYLNRPKDTALKFIACPFGAPGSRMYRTGDIVRFDAEGQLIFLGRIDNQVKIRGFRIELEEVESHLCAHPAVRQAVALASGDGQAEKRLVAYVTSSNPSLSTADLTGFLRSRLPDYMLPAGMMILEILPLTAHGKIDRSALPPIDFGSQRNKPPSDQWERQLAQLFVSVLAIKEVGAEDDFFDLGGDSLSASRLVSRARAVFGGKLSVRDIFEGRTVSRIAQIWRGRADIRPPIESFGQTRNFPLSFSQQRLLFMHEVQGGSPAYNISLVLRLEGRLDTRALEDAIGDVLERHEVLRTVYVSHEEGMIAEVLPFEPGNKRLRCTTSTSVDLAAALHSESQYVFELNREPPFRATLYGLSSTEYALHLLMHHIAADGWSLAPLVEDLGHAYTSRLRRHPVGWPTLRMTYSDYAREERRRFADADPEILSEQIENWRKALEGLPEETVLPADRPRTSGTVRWCKSLHWDVPSSLVENLRQWAKRCGATVFIVLETAVAAVLQRSGAGTDLALGTVIAGRMEEAHEDLVGLFVNTLVKRLDLSGDPTFETLVKRVREANIDALERQETPFEKVVEDLKPRRVPGRHPLFQVVVALQNFRTPKLSFPGLKVDTELLDPSAAKFDVVFDFCERFSSGKLPELHLRIDYAVDMFESATIDRVVNRLYALLADSLAHPQRHLSELAMLSATEREKVIGFGVGPPSVDFRDSTIHQLFTRQAESQPNARALSCGEEEITYGQLDIQSNRMAHYLHSLGIRSGSVVGLCLPRSIECIVALLAILKLGAVYLPLDRKLPIQRLGFMLRDASVALLISHSRHVERFGRLTVPVTLFDQSLEQIGAQKADPLISTSGPDSLAYIMFTSGSTGQPKGVGVLHRGVIQLARNTHHVSIVRDDVLLHVAPLAFDASTFEIWGALLNGAHLVVYPAREVEIAELHALIHRHRVSTTLLTTGLLHAIVDHDAVILAHFRQILTGGDVLDAARARRLTAACPNTALINCYGPTEATTYCACFTSDKPFGTSVPLGRPIANSRLYVLDERLQPCAIGIAGEIYIAGDGLARGYVNRPALTAQRFIACPYESPGARMYRTGDLGRWRVDGEMEFLGRADEQLKIRGFRVEPGEVERALKACRGVADAVVIAYEDPSGKKQLVAYLVAVPGTALQVADVRAALQQQLPEYMVPACFSVMAALPLTANGKINRAALPAPVQTLPSVQYAPPTGAIETTLAGIWSAILQLERVGVDQNFFELGGDSIQLIQVVAKAKRAGIHCTVRQILENQTIAALANVIGTSSAAKADQGEAEGHAPLTPIQHWFFELNLTKSSHFNQAFVFDPTRLLKANILQAALDLLVIQHDGLRLKFSQRPHWTQEHGVQRSVPLQVFELRALTRAAQQAKMEEVKTDLQQSFDLGVGPLLRAALFDLGEGGQRLWISIHHLIVDTVSWRILIDDLEAIYSALEINETPKLAAKTASFKEWAKELSNYGRSTDALVELAHWRGQPWSQAQPLPLDGKIESNMAGEVHSINTKLDVAITSILLKDTPARFHSQVNDVLLTALARALRRWTGANSHLVLLEGHGREVIAQDLDLTRTVGWFTSLFPVLLTSLEDRDVEAELRATHLSLRAIPKHGIGYGILRYLAGIEPTRLRELPMQLSFNYLGRLGDDLAAARLLRPAQDSVGPAIGPRNRRAHLIDVVGVVENGELHLNWMFCETTHRKGTIARVADALIDELSKIAEVSKSAPARIEPADGAALRNLPLSPLQQWFLGLDPAEPNLNTIKAIVPLEGDARIDTLRVAMQALVCRHDALRLMFRRGSNGWQQLISPMGLAHVAEYDMTDVKPEAEMAVLEGIALDIGNRIDITTGPLIGAGVANLRSGKQLVFVGHHLALDPVSTQLLLTELTARQNALRENRIFIDDAVSGSFEEWCNFMRSFAGTQEARQERDSLQQLDWAATVVLPCNELNRQDALARVSTQLNATQTSALKAMAGQFQSTTAELFATLLVKAFGAWGGQPVLSVLIIDNGRMIEAVPVDFSNTIGWLNREFPVLLDIRGSEDIRGATARVAKVLRAKPVCSINFRDLNLGENVPPPQITLNYQGVVPVAEFIHRKEAGVQLKNGKRASRYSSTSAVELHAAIAGGELQVHWTFNPKRVDADIVRSIADAFRIQLLKPDAA